MDAVRTRKGWGLSLSMCFFIVLGSFVAYAATPIQSGETLSGVVSAPAQLDQYTFEGKSGDRVLIQTVEVSGAINTEMVLVDPDFVDETSSAPRGNLLDHVLEKMGTYTVLVRDDDSLNTGSYNITLLNLTAGPLTSTSDPDGGPIASGETLNGSVIVSDLDAFQFFGEAGDRIILQTVEVSGAINTGMSLLAPDLSEEATTAPTGNILDHVLLQTGMYSVLVGDDDRRNAGTYSINLLNLTAGPLASTSDPDGGPIASGETLSGSVIVSDLDAFQFFGEAGDRIILQTVEVSGAINTEMVLVDPDFVDETSSAPRGNLLDHVLAKTGIYTVLVRDDDRRNAGTYNINLLNLTGSLSSPRDCDGEILTFGQNVSGALIVSDLDAFQFYGEAGDRIILQTVEVSGAINTEMVLIAPDLTDEANTVPRGNLMDHILDQSGLYKILVRDDDSRNAGTYNTTLNKFPDILGTGVYNPFPSNGCNLAADVTLSWDAVPDATGYDVLFGTDVIDPLEQVGFNQSKPSLLVMGLEISTVYYWSVVAHTPGGDIQGTVNWFVTEIRGDFDQDCDVDRVDLEQVATDFGRTDCDELDECPGDFDQDGDLDGRDMAVFAETVGIAVCQ
ncbi:fibronectin type III domain-containing protein [bacterium]|nr:fibronectin type III domain-containing protein [bacterium]